MNLKSTLALFLQLLSVMAAAQMTVTKKFSSEHGLCGTNIIVDSLGNFYREQGCEATSYISQGIYHIYGNRIDFKFQPISTLSAVHEVVESKGLNDSLVKITILTLQGFPVPNRFFRVDAIDTSGKFFETFTPDAKGSILVDCMKYKQLRFDYLEYLYKTPVSLPLHKKDSIVVLNLPGLFFTYDRPIVEKGKDFSLKLKKDGLYDNKGKEKLFSAEN